MQLNINLTDSTDTKAKGNDMGRVREAQAKKIAKDYIPTWDEVWVTGYTRHTGTVRKGILKTKLTDRDRERLLEVKRAVEQDELGTQVDSLKQFSKAHALNLYKVLAEIRKEGIIHKMIANRPANYITVNTPELLEQVVKEVEQEELIALDTETTGVEWQDTTVGMSVSLDKADKHYYIPYAHITEELQLSKEGVFSAMRPALERKGLKLVLHNSKFDAHMLAKDTIYIRDNIWADTMIVQAILNENEQSYALKKLANKYGKFFGYEDNSLTFEELFSKNPEEFIKADLALATIYACKDTHLTLLFYKWQMQMLNKHPKLKSVYFDIEQTNTHVAIEMESNGFEIDFSFSEEYKEELQAQVQELQAHISTLWGDVNMNSPKQMQELFYDKLGYKDVSGKRKVDAKTLKAMAKHHPDINTLLQYRDINKLLSTYIEPLPQKVRRDVGTLKGDNRLHGQFNQTGTVTGRWASKEPNLQNLPAKARKMIVAPEGKLLVGIDYSQIEPRTLASMSGDEGLQHPYKEGIDLYSSLASKIFKLPYEACLESDAVTWVAKGMPKHPRKMMKVGLLAVMYGITVPSLADTLDIPVPDAQKFMDDFYKAYPEMTKWMQEQVAFADETGYVETLFGRKRRFLGHKDVAKRFKVLSKKVVGILGRQPQNIWNEPLSREVKSSYFYANKEYSRVERMSVNAIIQGSASEILKKAMIKVYKHLETKGTDYRLIATIHDELMFELPETVTVEEIQELEDLMKGVVTLAVPLKVDTEVMVRWGEGIPMAEWIEKGMGRGAFKNV